MTETINLSKHRLVFFGFIWLVISGYVLRDAIEINFEPVLVLLFFYSLFLLYKLKPRHQVAIVHYWPVILFFYWLVNFVVLNYHGAIEDRASTIMNVVHATLIFVAIFYALLALRPSIDFFWYTLIFMGSVLAFLFIINFAAAGFNPALRIGEAYSNPIRFGVMSNTLFILLLGSFVWAYKKSPWLMVSIFLLCGILFVAVALSQTRTAWLGLPEALIAWTLYYLYLLAQKYHLSLKIKSILFFTPFIIIFTVYSIPVIKAPVDHRIGAAITDVEQYVSGENVHSSVGYRLLMYHVAYEGIKMSPWIGIGENDFREFLTQKSAELAKLNFNTEFDGLKFSHIHNQYLMAWLTEGVFGFISIMMMFAFLIYFYVTRLPRVDNEGKAVLLAGLVFTLASMLFFMPETPLQRSVQSTNFFMLNSLLVAFSYLTVHAQQSKT